MIQSLKCCFTVIILFLRARTVSERDNNDINMLFYNNDTDAKQR
jgi:hypothetical protein